MYDAGEALVNGVAWIVGLGIIGSIVGLVTYRVWLAFHDRPGEFVTGLLAIAGVIVGLYALGQITLALEDWYHDR